MDTSRRDAEPALEASRYVSLNYVTATRNDRWGAAGVALIMLVVAGVATIIGHSKAVPISAFLPTVTSGSIMAYALTASLLYAQYRAARHTPFAILSLAYAAAAGLLLLYVLTYPNVFSSSGLLGAGPETAVWLNVIWRVLFCLLISLYIAVERYPRLLQPRSLRVVASTVALLVVSATAITTFANAALPKIVIAGSYTPLYRTCVLPFVLGSLLLAGTLVISTRLRTRGHLWLAVVLFALLVEAYVTTFASGGRYDYGWYLARTGLAISSAALVIILQVQYATNLGRVMRANRNLHARNAQIQAFITLQDDIATALPSRAEVVRVILDFAQQQTRAHGSALEIPDGDSMLYEAAHGNLAAFVGTRIPRAGSLSGTCSALREVLLCEDTATDPRCDRQKCKLLGIGSMIVVPIPISADVTAVLKVASPTALAFNATDVQTLQLVAKNLAGGLIAAQEYASLESSERRYRVLTDAMPQLVGIIDRCLTIVYMNERCTAYTGLPLDATDAMADLRIIHHTDRRAAIAALRSALDNSADFEYEMRLRRTDSVYRWHSVRAVPLIPISGRPVHWIFTATDIEDRKVAASIITDSAARVALAAQNDRAVAATLREANRLMHMAEEMAHVGHYRFDFASREIYWSDEVYRTFGFATTQTPTLELIMEAYHPDDRASIVEVFRRARNEGNSFNFDSRIVRPDGTVRNVIAGGQVERAPDGTIVALFGVLQDVTAIKESERERERLSERVMLATKNGNIGVWEWDIAANTIEWDSAMYELYQVDEATCASVFDSWFDCIHFEDRAQIDDAIKRAVGGEAPYDTEFRAVRPSGEVRNIRAMGTVLRTSDGIATHMVGTNWDITEVRVLAQNLREEKERAEQASRTKSKFLARMSHEIRTPMNGIIGFSTLVLDGDLSPEQRRHVTLLRDAGRALLAIINDILDFSKIEAGKVDLEQIPLSINALVDGALSIVRLEALPKGITLDYNVGSDIPQWVNGDPTRLRQILLNLLTNALKFTDNGTIHVDVQRDRSHGASCLRFEIADSGIGIAPDQRHLLFGDFSQLEKSTARLYGGTGLGLAICKRLVEAMAGTIGVESAHGSGSVFWFTAELPEVDAPVLAANEPPPNVLESRRILVADDNRVNQIVVQSMLTRDGHDVVLADNGEEAVRAIATGAFDLVLMDMQMPVMDGLDATRAIRALAPPAGDIPIVALTANAMAEEIERCRMSGMNGHLAKPIDRELLRHAIVRWSRQTRFPAVIDNPPFTGDTTVENYSSLIDTPTLGIATLAEIFDGDMQSVGELFDAALASIEVDLRRIEQSLALNDTEMLIEAAHRMKGTSGSIRSQHVIHVSSTLELAAKTDPCSIEPTLLDTLAKAVAELRTDLEAHRRFLVTAS